MKEKSKQNNKKLNNKKLNINLLFNNNFLFINSEIGRLKRVLIHEPGDEINNLTPKYLEELLFDDIPWLPLAKAEHQAFAKAFKDNGVEVVYLVDLISEVLKDEIVKVEFIKDFINDLGNIPTHQEKEIYDYLMNIKDSKKLVKKCMSGIKKNELYKDKKEMKLDDYVNTSIFVTDPMPNLYFTRDPFTIINNGVSINSMYSKTRKRETIFAKYIFKYHKDYKNADIYYNRDDKYNIEGGDICVLSDKCLIIGVSERTSAYAIEKLAHRLFFDFFTSYDTILAFHIPKARTFMHLDTIFSQVDYDKFTIHKSCYDKMEVYELKKDNNSNKIITKKLNKKLELILEDQLHKKITLIPCGGKDSINSDREQWSDGSNCFCIAPGVVIAYERNDITNKLLTKHGIKVISIPSSELSRGRGGPRCMSMPLYREQI